MADYCPRCRYLTAHLPTHDELNHPKRRQGNTAALIKARAVRAQHRAERQAARHRWEGQA